MPDLLRGIRSTLSITFFSITIGTILGIMVGIGRLSRVPVIRHGSNIYVNCWRAIPVLVVMIWLFFSLPSLLNMGGNSRGMRISPSFAAIVALALYLSAMVGDLYLAGIKSIPINQIHASTLLGLSKTRIQTRIVIPQVMRNMMPALLGQYVSILLLSSLASVIAVDELLHQAQIIIARRYHHLEVYSAVALIYLAIALPLTILSNAVKHRSRRNLDAKNGDDVHTNNLPRKLNSSGYSGDTRIANLIQGSSLGICVEDVTVEGGKGRKIVEDITFSVQPGSVLSIIGPSGAGKTTLLKAIAGIVDLSRGVVSMSDGSKPKRGQIGMVFQGIHLWPHMTSLQNVREALIYYRNLDKSVATELAVKWLTLVGLRGKSESRPKRLSVGQAQRVAIARAMAVKPEILLLDEITSALDPELISEVLDIVKTLSNQGTTCVIVAHELPFVYELSDTVLFLDQGKVIDHGSPKEVFSGRHPRVNQFLNRHISWHL